MDLIKICKDVNKEVFTLKFKDKYLGLILGTDEFYLLPEIFDTPLAASNHARSQKKIHKVKANVKHAPKPKTASTLKPKYVLYTDLEVAELTHLRFKEAWVILSPQNTYVSSVLKDKKVASYSAELSKALVFRTYEEASSYTKTLDLVAKRGHQLRRYFIEHNKNTVS
jgi:hypothetical protein